MTLLAMMLKRKTKHGNCVYNLSGCVRKVCHHALKNSAHRGKFKEYCSFEKEGEFRKFFSWVHDNF